MAEFEFMGRQISIEGEGAKDAPFVLRGTGANAPLAAELENFVVKRLFGDKTWFLKGTRLEDGQNGETLAILTVRFFDDDNEQELLQTEVWFDVTEAFS